jgi:hypothetical protein
VTAAVPSVIDGWKRSRRIDMLCGRAIFDTVHCVSGSIQ